jgi:dTDP-glucose pyrophosphorylase
MAGLGRRFSTNGYTIPKQMVDINGKPMIEVSLDCIKLDDFKKVFIIRKEHIVNHNMDLFLKDKFGDDIKIVISETDTEGTVCTCLLAEEFLNNDSPLVITTLDVYFEPIFSMDLINPSVDGTILVFKSDNPNYSYSKINDEGFVIETAEKKVISDLSSIGLYYFKSSKDFLDYSKKMVNENIRTNNEFYVCPLYNLLINDGKKINTLLFDKCNSIGTPNEINEFILEKHK